MESSISIPYSQSDILKELRSAVQALSQRCLRQATKWTAELIVALPTKISNDLATSDARQTIADNPLNDVVVLARTYFDLGEYQRAAYSLSEEKSHLARFLRGYSLYMASEKRKQETSHSVVESSRPDDSLEESIRNLQVELSEEYERDQLDAFGLYLYGIILKQAGLTDDHKSSMADATTVLEKSILAYPWNWSAWLDLGSISPEKAYEQESSLAKCCPWMFDFFQSHALLENQQTVASLQVLQRLSMTFPKSTYLLAQRGLAQYNMRNFDFAEEEFQTLKKIDPYRLDNLDVYSNVLYVKECKTELSMLAHSAVKIDKFRPETCCVLGNYYSLKGKHERAVLYFQRALKLDSSFLAAWTLIGHEYVELKNTSAAIEAYRKAVDISPADYRAWYGLGQTYEILQMFYYALYYYRKAAMLRPYDARMWCALAGCYQRLDQRQEAVLCYERAICNNDREGIAAVQLAKLYRDMNARDRAAHYFNLHLEKRPKELHHQDTIEAILFMAHYYKEEGRLRESSDLCNRLLDRQGPETDEAKALLRELRNLERGTDTESHPSRS